MSQRQGTSLSFVIPKRKKTRRRKHSFCSALSLSPHMLSHAAVCLSWFHCHFRAVMLWFLASCPRLIALEEICPKTRPCVLMTPLSTHAPPALEIFSSGDSMASPHKPYCHHRPLPVYNLGFHCTVQHCQAHFPSLKNPWCSQCRFLTKS